VNRTLAIAPSSYDAAKTRPPSARVVRDEALSGDISRIHAEQFGAYGVRKAWRVLRREGVEVGRDRVGRLMRALGLAGATRTKRIRMTRPAPISQRPAELVERVFRAPAPNRLCVAHLTYVWTRAGFVCRLSLSGWAPINGYSTDEGPPNSLDGDRTCSSFLRQVGQEL